MSLVTVSPQYRIVIPKEVRQSMGITPGQKFAVYQFDNRFELVPIKGIRKIRRIARSDSSTVKGAKHPLRQHY